MHRIALLQKLLQKHLLLQYEKQIGPLLLQINFLKSPTVFALLISSSVKRLEVDVSSKSVEVSLLFEVVADLLVTLVVD